MDLKDKDALVQDILLKLKQIAWEIEKVDLVITMYSRLSFEGRFAFEYEVLCKLSKLKGLSLILSIFDQNFKAKRPKAKRRLRETLIKLYKLCAIYLMTNIAEHDKENPPVIVLDNFAAKFRKFYADTVCEGKIEAGDLCETKLLFKRGITGGDISETKLFFKNRVLGNIPKDEFPDISKEPFLLLYLLNQTPDIHNALIKKMTSFVEDELKFWRLIEAWHKYEINFGNTRKLGIPYNDGFASEYLWTLKRIFLSN